jgi:hypothetical protein
VGESAAADLFLRQSFRRIRQFLAGLTDNDDKAVLATADAVLGKVKQPGRNGR